MRLPFLYAKCLLDLSYKSPKYVKEYLSKAAHKSDINKFLKDGQMENRMPVQYQAKAGPTTTPNYSNEFENMDIRTCAVT